ncbi:MAG: sigma 54-interacting transcriptional regulator, partial [Planctomycetes bacterium]|nr:sigma 54-interacting transcriptional regulator [Planctomycetota bacterium]
MSRILVVDDRTDNLLVVDRHLTDAGYAVDTVSSAEFALARVASGQRYDLFVLDVVLPGISGFELCQRLRSRVDTADTPILFLTGEKHAAPDKVKGFDVGANDYLAKPVDSCELLARVGMLLRLRKALFEVQTANERLERLVDDRTAELRDALQSLERQRHLWEGVVRGLPSAVFVYDVADRLLRSNDAAEDLVGPIPLGASLSTSPLAPFFEPEHRQELDQVGGRVVLEIDTRHRGRRWIEAESTRLDGDEPRWLIHLRDVTERVQALDEAERRGEERLQDRIAHLERQLDSGTGYRMTQVVGHSPAMARVHQQVDQLRKSRASVLICGESGTGKELVARAIHYDGELRDRPFVPVHCGAIPASLAESELFGYVRGAFTGATSNVKGLFEVADGGTIFLDEIGECSPDVQAKLLRVLQSGEIRPVGANRERIVDVRLIAATNQPLAEMARRGEFREDLYYRLNVVQIDLPSLRDRNE